MFASQRLFERWGVKRVRRRDRLAIYQAVNLSLFVYFLLLNDIWMLSDLSLGWLFVLVIELILILEKAYFYLRGCFNELFGSDLSVAFNFPDPVIEKQKRLKLLLFYGSQLGCVQELLRLNLLWSSSIFYFLRRSLYEVFAFSLKERRIALVGLVYVLDTGWRNFFALTAWYTLWSRFKHFFCLDTLLWSALIWFASLRSVVLN